MTDPDLLAKRLAVIDTCVRDLRELARPDALRTDVREERFVEHTLQLAIQAALDGIHLVYRYHSDRTANGEHRAAEATSGYTGH